MNAKKQGDEGTYQAHTSLKGAQHNAKCVVKGLKKMKSSLAKFLK